MADVEHVNITNCLCSKQYNVSLVDIDTPPCDDLIYRAGGSPFGAAGVSQICKGNPVMSQQPAQAKPGQGPKYILNIEGEEFPWDQDTITTEQIAELGGWNLSEGVIEVDKDNNERTLAPDEVVEVKPGMGFGKKHLWKRG
jgi:hypothetical protein